MSWLKLVSLASLLVKAWRETVAFFSFREAKEAGRAEAKIAQKEATDAVIDAALAARRDQRARNADPDSLREPDPYLRD